MKSIYKKKSGIILLNILLILSISTMLVFSLAYASRGCMRRIKVLKSQIEFEKKCLGELERFLSQGENASYEVDKGYQVTEEESRLNVNALSSYSIGIFIHFLELLKVDSERANIIAYSLLDWKDQNDQKSHNFYGAESEYYLQQNPPYQCKNFLIESKEELLLIRGMDQELLERVSPYITIFPIRSSLRIYFEGASNVVLQALARDEAQKMKIDLDTADSFIEKMSKKGDSSFFDVEERLLSSQIAKYRKKRSYLKRVFMPSKEKDIPSFDILVSENNAKIMDWNFIKMKETL